jgi:predicted Rdx family selenoprotein|tara:strand:+ start:256 stop:408 length:153 start_codon:yes stop_codon:yes gene_type:complete
LILDKVSGADIELVSGGGGVFDIDVDGQRAYSKAATGRFPTDDEVRNSVS